MSPLGLMFINRLIVRSVLVIGSFLSLSASLCAGGKDVQTGIELVAPSPKEKALYSWHIEDAKTKKRIASVSGRWGFEPVPPGEYELVVQQHEAAVPYGKVQVVKDKVTKIEVKAGVELVGHTAKEPPLYRWFVTDPKGEKEITHVDVRWGFTPVPPGEYAVWVQKHEEKVLWSTVQVGKDKPTRVEVKSGVEVLGRSSTEPPLYRWFVMEPKTKKAVTYMDGKWGFTPVPPGDYEVWVQKYEEIVLWGSIKVVKDKSTRVDVKSGVEVVGNSPKETPPYRWSVVDPKSKKTVTYANSRWGFTPVPPGDYELHVQHTEEMIPFTTVRIAKDKVVRVEVKSGVELVGRSPKEAPPYRWVLSDAKTKKSVTAVSSRWGFTPVPPGEYTLQISPRGSESFDWTRVTVTAGSVVKVKAASGVELSPRLPNDPPPTHWYIYDVAKKSSRPIDVNKRWGFVLLPPGEYAITLGIGTFPLRKVKLAEGEVANIQLPDLKERLAAVTGAGRQPEKQRDPENYKKLEEEVERAIRRAALWLKKQSSFGRPLLDLKNERLTIGVLALLHSGEFERDPALADRCLDYLLRRPLNDSSGTYSCSLTAMALGDLDPHGHAHRMLECAQWLVENQGWDKKSKVWGYGDAVPGIGELKKAKPLTPTPLPEGEGLTVVRRGLIQKQRDYWDNSCSQFGMLGLHSAAYAGLKLPRECWQRAHEHFRERRNEDGGWGYFGNNSSSGSMTCAGLASLLLAKHHLGEANKTNEDVVRGLEWLAGHFTLETNPPTAAYHYYYLYGLERVGVLGGTEFLGDHEWYPEGARYLLAKQNANGSWKSEKGDGDYLDTCYAILFLRRATLPPVPPKPGMIEVVYKQPKLPPTIVPNIELVLDCSGSMEEKVVGGEDRITVARRVMDKLVTEIPDSFNVGFRIFGAQGFWDWRTKGQAPDKHPGWNTDTQLLVPMGPLGEGARRAEMRKWINSIECKGATPLCYALLQTRKDFHDSMKGPKAVVLISDGLENCGGKMEDVEKAYKDSGIDVVIHVVGFAIKEKEHKVLEQLSKWTRGNYYRADDANQLAKALKEAMGSLNFVVHNEGGRVVAQGPLNGPGVTLKAGNYQVSIQGIREAPLRVQIESGQRLQLTLDDAGRLTSALVPGKTGSR